MTHPASSPAQGTSSPDQSSCTRVPNVPSGAATPTHAHPSALNTDLEMTENRVVDTDDVVEDISCKKTCDESSSKKLVKQRNDSTVEENKTKDNMFEKTTDDNEESEEFSGQIVYNPDGSAFILEESDETLLDQIPTQEGAIVERAGRSPPLVADYPKINQTVYVARRKAWYTAMGSAYRQMMQGRGPQSPVVHNFRVVNVSEAAKPSQKEEAGETDNKGKSRR